MTRLHIKLAKCGCNCKKCPTYKSNIPSMELRQKCSDGWEKYLDIKLSPSKLKACDGCSIPDSERKTYYLNCNIRKCAIINKIENCAYCSAFPCEELLKVHSIQNINSIEDFRNKTNKVISDSDFEYFVLPYMGLQNLIDLRKNISNDEIKKFKVHECLNDISSQKKPQTTNSLLHNLITAICVENKISYARLQFLKHKREQILKIIWTTALHGTLNEKGAYIEIDSRQFLAQKINCMLKALQGYFEEMKKYNMHCAIIPKSIQGWLTPTGALRKEGWVFRLSFENAFHDNVTLKELSQIVMSLNLKYKDEGYRMFCKGVFE